MSSLPSFERAAQKSGIGPFSRVFDFTQPIR